MTNKSVDTLLWVDGLINGTYNLFPLSVTENMTNTTPAAPPPNFCKMKPPMEQWETDLSFYLNGVITIIIIILGLVGNSLTVIVLANRTMRTSTNCFLMALAIWDSIVLLVTFFLISLGEFSGSYKQIVFPYIVAFIYPLGLVAQTITIWLTVSFTVERYIAVCHPLKACTMCTIQRARMVIVGVCVVSLLYNVCRWFEYEVIGFTHPPTNDSCVILKPTEFNNDQMYHKIYFGWSYFMVMCVIPLITLAVLNTFLILAVRRSKEQRKDMNVRQSRENNVTIMLISVVLLFMIFQVPALIYNMAYAIDTKATSTVFGWKILSTIRNFLVNLNSAVNFILYCALGQKFRRTFVRTFCPKLCKNLDNFNSFSNAHKMDKLKKVNGSPRYMKIAGKNNHTSSSTADSGVVTRCTGVARYSSSESKLSDKSPKKHNDSTNVSPKPKISNDLHTQPGMTDSKHAGTKTENNSSNLHHPESKHEDKKVQEVSPEHNSNNTEKNTHQTSDHNGNNNVHNDPNGNLTQAKDKGMSPEHCHDSAIPPDDNKPTGNGKPDDNKLSSVGGDLTDQNKQNERDKQPMVPSETSPEDKQSYNHPDSKPTENGIPNTPIDLLKPNGDNIPNDTLSDDETFLSPSKNEMKVPLLILLEDCRESDIL